MREFLKLFSVRPENPEHFLPTMLAGWRTFSTSDMEHNTNSLSTYTVDQKNYCLRSHYLSCLNILLAPSERIDK